jgi:hypothetical protein
MTTPFCRHEEDVVSAFIGGHLSDSLAEHLTTCETCRDAVDMVCQLRSDRTVVPEETADTATANIIWTRAMLTVREKRPHLQRLGRLVAALSGILVASISGLVILPTGSEILIERIDVTLSHLSLLALPAGLVLVAASLVVFAGGGRSTVSGKR